MLSISLCVVTYLTKEIIFWLLHGIHIFFNNESLLWLRMLLSNAELWLILVFFISLLVSIWYGGKLLIYSQNSQKKLSTPTKPTVINTVFNGQFHSLFSLFFLTLVMIGGVIFDEDAPVHQEPLDSGITWLDFVINNGLEITIVACLVFGLLSLVVLIWNIQRNISFKINFKW